MKYTIITAVLILSQISFAAKSTNASESKRKPASSGVFYCNMASGNSFTLENEMKGSCDTKLPLSIAAIEKNGVTQYTYCCTAK